MTVERRPVARGRAAGAVAGALIGIVPVAIGQIAHVEIFVPAGILGGVAGGLLGARYGPGVRNRSRVSAAFVAVRMSVLAVLIGDLLVCAVLALAALGSPNPGSAVFPLILLPLLGVGFFGLPALGMALIAGFAWVVVMRATPARWVLGRFGEAA
jgi:hypothetical protein